MGHYGKPAKQHVLAKELQKNVPAAQEIPQPSACIIDGIVLVQRLKGDHKKFQMSLTPCLECFYMRVRPRRKLTLSSMCIERVQLRIQKESIEGLSMEMNLEISNPTIRCSSGETESTE